MLNKGGSIILRALLLFTAFAEASEHTVVAQLSKVIDGDTVYVETEANNRLKIRLAFIDAPELNQPFGKDAKVFLKKFEGKYVKIKAISRDRYSRSVAIIFYKGDDINLLMIKNGYAWAYKKYLKNAPVTTRDKYLHEESVAKESGLGLWRVDTNIAPWDWRKQIRRGYKPE